QRIVAPVALTWRGRGGGGLRRRRRLDLAEWCALRPLVFPALLLALIALSAGAAQGGRLHGYVAVALAPGGFFHFTRLMVPEKVNSFRSPERSVPRRKISEPPARVTSPSHSINSPSRAASRNSQAKLTVTPGLCKCADAIANRQ